MIRITSNIVAVLGIFVIQALAASDPRCLHPDGRFIDPEQCDAYYECKDDVAEWKLCPDGLRFNPKMGGNCVYKPAVFCGNRTKLQSPHPTKHCPRQFGFYRIGDAEHCGTYMNCAHGVGKKTTCPEGLAFNEKSYKCDWPDETDDCDPEAFLGFTCPDPIVRTTNTQGAELLRYYRNEDSCVKYYVCENDRPRLYRCSPGSVFNDLKKSCDSRSNIEECNPRHRAVHQPVVAEEKPKAE